MYRCGSDGEGEGEGAVEEEGCEASEAERAWRSLGGSLVRVAERRWPLPQLGRGMAVAVGGGERGRWRWRGWVDAEAGAEGSECMQGASRKG